MPSNNILEALSMRNELGLFEKKNQILVSSRIVAEHFGRMHKNVLRDIRGIIRGVLKSEHTPLSGYFIESKHINEQNHQEYFEYLLTKDGFLMYVFSFQGNELFKMQYIKRFDEMEAALRERQTTDWLQTREKGKMIRRQETDAIQQLIPYAQEQGSQNALKLYMTYSKLVNSIMSIESGKRNQATGKQLMQISLLEDMITNTIIEEMGKGVYYKEVYKICKKKAELFAGLTYIDSKRTALTNTDAAN